METLDFAMNFEDNEQSEADKKLFVVFYKGTVHNEVKSTEAGRPIFDEVELVRIMTPGSRDTFVGDATYPYQQRFPHQWAKFKQGADQNLAGTPLNQLPWLSISQVAEFNAVGCHTVEQLVGMSDAMAHKFMGFNAIKDRAGRYLDAAKEHAPTLKFQAELAKRDEENAELKATVAAMKARLDSLEVTKVGQAPPKA